MIEHIDSKKDNLIALKISGKLSKEDLESVHKRIHQITEKGRKVDFYFEFENFKGYTLEGFIADIKIDTSHLSDYGRMAFVGDKKWQEWAARITDFFTDSEVRFFEKDKKDTARIWIQF
ncbi:STAS/SEC14 domain-containing protein [Robertkochia aurantiaca]|uniref:STAS/SEC14 domain-containing protein n=1 Tax=Robertkochia aurantiaca TaxID=2873700 RepID=UPI001CC97D36|nr:STAS/SEC14 domain-containing protein [Robertkochia sp. 3YJGBD-33]